VHTLITSCAPVDLSQVYDVDTCQLVAAGACPLSPGSSSGKGPGKVSGGGGSEGGAAQPTHLTWLGFTDGGLPAVADSTGCIHVRCGSIMNAYSVATYLIAVQPKWWDSRVLKVNCGAFDSAWLSVWVCICMSVRVQVTCLGWRLGARTAHV
jgi:hypothetical protein